MPVSGGAALWSDAFPHRLTAPAVDLGAVLDRSVAPPWLGAGATLAAVARDDAIRRGWPAVAEAAGCSANPNVRRLATVGGTVAARLVSCDLAVALVAHDSIVTLAEPSGTRTMPVLDYLGKGAAGPHIVAGVELGAPEPSNYRRATRRQGPAPALAAVAVVGEGAARRAWAGAVAATPIPLGEAHHLLDDHRASGEERRVLLGDLARATVTYPQLDGGGGETETAPSMGGSWCVEVDGVSEPIAPGEALDPLATWLRDRGYVSIKVGCGEGVCGACTVLWNDAPVPACLVPVARAAGGRVSTPAAVATTPSGRAVVEALVEHAALQCGYCTPGLMVTLAAAHRDGASLVDGLDAHLCRCTGYQALLEAVASLS
jgi:aerobic-type carbon monoxide dehydrogenase small subunit (CoxS/CutS family)